MRRKRFTDTSVGTSAVDALLTMNSRRGVTMGRLSDLSGLTTPEFASDVVSRQVPSPSSSGSTSSTLMQLIEVFNAAFGMLTRVTSMEMSAETKEILAHAEFCAEKALSAILGYTPQGTSELVEKVRFVQTYARTLTDNVEELDACFDAVIRDVAALVEKQTVTQFSGPIGV